MKEVFPLDRKGRNSKFLLVVLVVLIFSLISFSIIIIFSLYRFYDDNEDLKEDLTRPLRKYKYVEIDSKRNKTTWGVVKREKMDKDEIVSYQLDENKHVLISEFGTDEYFCSGSCYCDPGDGRRNAISLSRGVTYVVAAISSLVAYTKAKEWYEEECTDEDNEWYENWLDECGYGKIRAEIDECERAMYGEEEGSYGNSDETKCYRPYVCLGDCANKDFIDTKPETRFYVKNLLEKEFGSYFCEILLVEERVDVECGKNTDFYMQDLESEEIKLKLAKKAKEKFSLDHQLPFCRKHSIVTPKIFEKYREEYLTLGIKEGTRVCRLGEVKCQEGTKKEHDWERVGMDKHGNPWHVWMKDKKNEGSFF